MTSIHKPHGPYEAYFKRPLDFVLSFGAFLFFIWLYLIVAILVRLKLGSPVLFTQDRPGKDEKIFKLYKFRTMTDKKDDNGELLPDELRLTSFGKWLRSTSLDEIPELFNIIKGDMSIVGPRPLLISYLPWYNDTEKHRHDVRPGLTGWAQVNGRNSVDWSSRFKLDVEYVNRISFKMDVKIILMTVAKVLNRSNVAEDTRVAEGNFAEIRKQALLKEVGDNDD